MSKLKSSLVKGVAEKKEFESEQSRLKEKHKGKIKAEDQDKVIVEKSNMAKFITNRIVALIKLIATILLITLAAIGVLSLLYPSPRQALFDVLNQMYQQALSFI